MKFLNVEIPVKNLPELDSSFVPLGLFFKEYQKGAKKPLCIAVERSGGQIGTYETKVYGTPDMAEADAYYVDRLVKFLCGAGGGFKVYVCGDEAVGERIRQAYTATGSRAFDKGFMEQVYETQFTVEVLPYEKKPAAFQRAQAIGRHTNGARIGFDAGGSDRKVSAVIDGEPVYSEEVVWFPESNCRPGLSLSGHPGGPAHGGGQDTGKRPQGRGHWCVQRRCIYRQQVHGGLAVFESGQGKILIKR